MIYRRGRLKKPTGFPYTPEFAIYRNGNTVTTSFDADDYIVESSVTYYFSPSGNDSNDGLSAQAPKRKISTVITTLNASPPASGVTFILAPGRYGGTDGFGATSMLFSCNVICESGRAEFYFTDTMTWSKTAGRTNVYQSSTTRTKQAVVDLASTDSYGVAKRLREAADIATVDATQGSCCTVGSILYVHTYNSRAADASVMAFSPLISAWTQINSHQFFVRNIDFWGYLQPVFINNSAASRFVFDNCTFCYSYSAKNGLETSSTSHADTLVILNNCVAAYNSYDGFGYRGSNTIIEIGCKGVWNGFVGANDADNGSTAHESAVTLRINGTYRYNGDRNVHDIGSTKNWLIGCSIGDAQNGSSDKYESANYVAGRKTQSDATQSWVESCTSYGGSVSDIASYGSSIVNTLACSGFALSDTDGSGAIVANSELEWPDSAARGIARPLTKSLTSPLTSSLVSR